MNIRNLLLAFWDPGIGVGFVHALSVIVNLAFIVGGITLLAYICCYLRTGLSESLEQFRKRPTIMHYSVAIATTVGLITLSVFAVLDQTPGTLVSGSYSLADLARLIIAIVDPLLDIRHLADSPIKEFFGLNLIVRTIIIYILAAALQFSIKQAGNAAVHFNIFLKEKLLADQPQSAVPSEDMDTEKTAKAEIQMLVEHLIKLLVSSGFAVFAAFVLGSDDMRKSISEVLEICKDIIGMITLLSNVETGGGASGFFSNVLYILLSLVMLAIYVTATLLLIIFIYTIYKNWPKIVAWLVEKAKNMRIGVAAMLLALTSLAIVIGAGVCLKKYPFLQLDFEGGLTGALRIVVNYAVVILAIVIVLMLLIFAVSFLVLIASYSWNTVKQKGEEWEKNFSSDKYWNVAKVAACIILAGIFLIIVALCYDKLRDWLMVIFNPGKKIFSPVQVFKYAAIFVALLAGLVLLISTATVLGFIIFWGIVEFFLTTRKNVVTTASKLAKETLTSLLDTLSLAPFILGQVCLLVKSIVKTVLQIFTGYRTESDKNNAIFMAACFASLASLLNTFFGLYQFYGGGDEISGYSDWVRTICTLAIACAAQLAMLVFGMKAGEGLAEWRIIGGDYTKNKLINIITRAILVIGVLVAAGSLYTIVYDIFFSDFHLKDLIKYIPWLAGSMAAFALYHWLKKRQEHSRNNETQISGAEENLVPTEVLSLLPVSNQPQKHRRLPFYWYLAVYLLLMIVSTGFAYSNLFGYYAHGAKVHERVYSQVRYEADKELQLSERVANVVEDYTRIARELGEKFSTRAASAVKEKNSKEAELRHRAEGESAGEYAEENRRDRFIGQTKDLEQVVSNIQSLLTAQYDNIGSTTAIEVEEYAHYWGYSPQPSYSTTCIVIHLDGDLDDNVDTTNKGQIITVGDLVKEDSMDVFPATAHEDLAGQPAPAGRIVDPASPSQSIIKTTRYVLNADKYDILKELFNQYERMENEIYSFKISNYTGDTGIDTTISEQIYPGLDRNAQLDGIRANIVALYQDSKRSLDSFSGFQTTLDRPAEPIPMPELPRIAEAYLSGSDTHSKEKQGGNESDEKTALPEYENLSDYIDRALALNSILLSFDTSTGDDSGKTDAVYKTQQYRNYARGLAHLEFQISYDALFRGSFKMNPVRDKINELYTTSTIATFLLFICLLIDMLAFVSGLLLFKSIYLFGKNSGILQMGYLNFEIALSYLFAIPKDFHSRVLHLAFIYKVLYGDASAPAGLEDSNIRDYPSDNHELDPEDNAPDTSPKPDNMAGVKSPEDIDSDGTSDDTDLIIPDENNSDEQNPAAVEDAVDSEKPASVSNPNPAPTDASETEEALSEEEASIPDANSRPEEVLPLQDGLDSGDCPPDNSELEPEKHISDISHESDNMADLKSPEDADSRGTPDSTDSVPPDPSNLDEQNSDNENTVDSEKPASTSNPNAASTDASETEETFPVKETFIPDADSETDESLSQQVGLDTTEQAGEGQENEDAKTVSEYLQDMDYLHQIMRSEDYKKLNENMIATLKILGITEFSDGDEEQNISYASLQMWLRNFIEENNITFDELFTPPK